MPALRSLQSDMSAAIRDAVAEEHLRPRALPALAQPERLALHARNYRAGLIATLAAIFPATQRLTGEGFFLYVGAQFIAAHPPRDPVLAHYGANFPAFLAAHPALTKSPWLTEAARLEWAIHALADRQALAPLDLAALAHRADARFAWHPDATLFHAHFPADELIDPDGDLAALDLNRPCYLLLTPGMDGVIQNTLSAPAFAFLTALSGGQPFSVALGAAPPQSSFDPVATLRLAARLGCFAAIHSIKDHP